MRGYGSCGRKQYPENFSKNQKGGGGSIMIYIGCDPGNGGALAVIWPNENVEVVTFGKDEYRDILHDVDSRNAKCCLEHVWGIKGQAAGASFNFGENYGFIQGLLTAYSIPYELVTPNKWKKEFQVTGDKNSSIAVCKRLFPNVNLRRTDRCRKDDDNMAEALLLAEFAKRRM